MSEEEFFDIAKKLDFERYNFYIWYTEKNNDYKIINYIRIEDIEKIIYNNEEDIDFSIYDLIEQIKNLIKENKKCLKDL